jgi:hypothetical protein
VKGLETGSFFDTFEAVVNKPPEEVTDPEREDRGCHLPSALNPTGTLLVLDEGLVFCGGQPPADVPNDWDSGWRTVTLDLGQFAGESVTLYVVTWSREYSEPFYDDKGFYNTYSYVDNFSLLGDW